MQPERERPPSGAPSAGPAPERVSIPIDGSSFRGNCSSFTFPPAPVSEESSSQLKDRASSNGRREGLSVLDRHLLTAAKGGGVVFGGKLFTYASRFVFVLILARMLAAEQYGQYNLSLTTVEVLAGLASLGLPTALVRFVAMFASRGDRAGLWGALQVCLGLTTAVSLVLAVGLYSLAGIVGQHVFHNASVAPLLRLVSVFLPFFTFNDAVAAATRGFKNMHYSTLAQFICHPLIKLVLILLLLAVTGLSTTLALVVSGTAEIMVSAMLLYFLRKQLRAHRTDEPSRREPGMMLRYSLPLYFSDLLNEFSGNFQVLFLGAFSSSSQVGVFALAKEISRLSQFFQRSVTTSSQPIVSEMFTRDAKQEFAGFYQNMTKWTLALNLPMLLLLVLLPGPLLSLFGETFAAGGVAILWVFVGRRLLHVATGMCGVVLDMSGHTRLKLLNSVVRVVLLIALNLWLIPRWGALGAAISAAVSESTDSLLRLIQVRVLFRTFPYNASFLKTIAAAVIAAVSGLLIGRWLPPERNVLYAATSCVAVVSTYFVATLMMGLSREEQVVLARARNRAVTLLARIPVSSASR